MNGQWLFSFSGLAWIASVIALVVFGGFAIHNVRHSSNRRNTIILEALRLIVIAFLVFTLFQPEWAGRIEQARRPRVAVLIDTSESMASEDLLREGNALSRRDFVAERRADTEWQAALEDRFNLQVLEFAGTDDASGGTDIAAALERTLAGPGDLRSVLLISDGDWNAGGDPVAAAIKLRTSGVPVFSLGVGRETFLPDVALENVQPPMFATVGERVLIPFTVVNTMQTPITVNVFLRSTNTVGTEKVVQVQPGESLSDSMMWMPSEAGEYRFVLEIPPLPGEARKDNNRAEFKLEARLELIKVLVVDSTPRWEYRYLRNALMRDPAVEVNTILFHQRGMRMGAGPGYLNEFPSTIEQIAGYDVVFLGDIGLDGNGITTEQAELLRGLVENQGSGLVFLPGRGGKQYDFLNSPLNDLLPVQMDPDRLSGYTFRTESRMALTSKGSDHLLTLLAATPAMNQQLWQNLPGFFWSAGVLRARTGATVLAVNSALRNDYGRLPLLVTRPFGSGQTLFMGTDSAWRWRRGVEDKYHYRFWGQVVRWMAHKRHMAYTEQMRVFYTPERPALGDRVSLWATAFDAVGFPLTGVDMECRVKTPEGDIRSFPFAADKDEQWGVYSGSFVAKRSGPYNVEIRCPAADLSFNKEIIVTGGVIEKIGEPAKLRTLRDISRITGGEFGTQDQWDEIVNAIQSLPEKNEHVRHIRFWAQWWWGALILLLMSVYWILRKVFGLI
jgi:uncharacterized membrane protein